MAETSQDPATRTLRLNAPRDAAERQVSLRLVRAHILSNMLLVFIMTCIYSPLCAGWCILQWRLRRAMTQRLPSC